MELNLFKSLRQVLFLTFEIKKKFAIKVYIFVNFLPLQDPKLICYIQICYDH